MTVEQRVASLEQGQANIADVLVAQGDALLRLDQKTDALAQKVDALAQKVDALDQKVDAGFKRMDSRLDAVERGIGLILERLEPPIGPTQAQLDGRE